MKEDNIPEHFRNLVDYVILQADNDPELANGIKFLDELAKHSNVSFYVIMAYAFIKVSVDGLAAQWLEDKHEL